MPGSEGIDWPAWVQAVGSVLGIGAGAAAIWWQVQEQRVIAERQRLQHEIDRTIELRDFLAEVCKHIEDAYAHMGTPAAYRDFLGVKSYVSKFELIAQAINDQLASGHLGSSPTLYMALRHAESSVRGCDTVLKSAVAIVATLPGEHAGASGLYHLGMADHQRFIELREAVLLQVSAIDKKLTTLRDSMSKIPSVELFFTRWFRR